MDFTGLLPIDDDTWKRFDERHGQMAISGKDQDVRVASLLDFGLPDEIGREWVLGAPWLSWWMQCFRPMVGSRRFHPLDLTEA